MRLECHDISLKGFVMELVCRGTDCKQASVHDIFFFFVASSLCCFHIACIEEFVRCINLFSFTFSFRASRLWKFMSAYFYVRTYAYNGGIIGAMYLGTVGRLRYGLNVGSRAANPPPLDAS